MRHGRILFISDLHLGAAPGSIDQFTTFLRTEATRSDALYILGDLFETWIGDDDDDVARSRATTALRELVAGGTPCFIQHGNRDFLLGAGFALASGCQLLPDPTTLDIDGRRFVLTHGDQLCTEDLRYQRYRRLVRNPAVQALWRALPLDLRRRLAGSLRRRSHAHVRQQPAAIMDVTPTAVAALLESTRGNVLVHGHTHRPAVHAIDVGGSARTRIVLGDWPDQATMLQVNARGEFNVRTLSPQGAVNPDSAMDGAPE
jgi:UDP-2,3-diacylglucosamine hydrolase